jgi:hypothetical protein
MASFSSKYPVAVHVLPLPALKQVLARGALLAKSEIPVCQQRRSTRGVDSALGFTGVVHLYLSAFPENGSALPILAAQIGPSRDPPFPHVVLALPTRTLTDDECAICLWNIAVSRPRVANLCEGGNWARGTAPERIAEVWQRFRATQPALEAARGHWNGAALVPTLEGRQIANNLPLLSRAAGRSPELLLRAPVSLGRDARLCVFSKEDAACVDRLGPGLPMELHAWPEYDAGCPDTAAWRHRIDAYLPTKHLTPTNSIPTG